MVSGLAVKEFIDGGLRNISTPATAVSKAAIPVRIPGSVVQKGFFSPLVTDVTTFAVEKAKSSYVLFDLVSI